MSAVASSSKASSSQPNAKPAPAELQAKYNKYKSELTAVATKVGELEGEGEEHDLVLKTLEPLLKTHPNRKCYRLIGGVLVERTVVEAEGMLRTNIEGIQRTINQLLQQYKTTEEEFKAFQKDNNIQVITR